MEILRLRKGQEGRAVAVLAEAMYDDPVLRWLFPDPEGRTRAMPYAMGYAVAQAMASDGVLMDGSGRSASAWAVRGDGAAPDEAPDEEGSDALAPHAERLSFLGRLIAERQPTGPHLYLSVIGVLSGARGRGVGGAMLDHRLADTGLPAYLEASSDRSRELYLRHGFAPHGAPLRIPGGPTLHPMLRPAP